MTSFTDRGSKLKPRVAHRSSWQILLKERLPPPPKCDRRSREDCWETFPQPGSFPAFCALHSFFLGHQNSAQQLGTTPYHKYRAHIWFVGTKASVKMRHRRARFRICRSTQVSTFARPRVARAIPIPWVRAIWNLRIRSPLIAESLDEWDKNLCAVKCHGKI